MDTETSGLDIRQHKVLELAFQLVDLSDSTVQASFSSLISLSKEEWQKSDAVSLAVNGLTWEEVSKGQPLATVSSQVKELLVRQGVKRGQAVFICQNPSFDRNFFTQILDIKTQEQLQLPYHWLDLASMYWAYAMHQAKEKNTPFPWETGFTKDKIAAHFHLSSEQRPHRAMNGVAHLIKCYEAVVGFPKKVLV